MNETFDIKEPDIKRKDILLLEDPAFIPENVCIVTGAGSGIGRAVSIASAVNGLFTIGVDCNEKALEKTVEIATNLGGKMDFVRADLTVDKLGRVNVKTTTNHCFSTDLDHLPLELLLAIAKVLETQAYNRILKKIEKRTRRSIRLKQTNQSKEPIQ